MGKILNIWARRHLARTKFPVGSKVLVRMPEAWLDGKVGEVKGYDMLGKDIDLYLHITKECINTTAPMNNCIRM